MIEQHLIVYGRVTYTCLTYDRATSTSLCVVELYTWPALSKLHLLALPMTELQLLVFSIELHLFALSMVEPHLLLAMSMIRLHWIWFSMMKPYIIHFPPVWYSYIYLGYLWLPCRWYSYIYSLVLSMLMLHRFALFVISRATSTFNVLNTATSTSLVYDSAVSACIFYDRAVNVVCSRVPRRVLGQHDVDQPQNYYIPFGYWQNYRNSFGNWTRRTIFV